MKWTIKIFKSTYTADVKVSEPKDVNGLQTGDRLSINNLYLQK